MSRLRKSDAKTLFRDIVIQKNLKCLIPKDKVLSNYNNKRQFVSMLIDTMKANGMAVLQAEEDADYSIVKTALDYTKEGQPTVILGDDIGLLIIMTDLCKPGRLYESVKNIYFCKWSKDETKICYFSHESLNYTFVRKFALFAHAFGGCDTTCATYVKGKEKPFKVINEDPSLRKDIELFYQPDANATDILPLMYQFTIKTYSGTGTTDLVDYRYCHIKKSTQANEFKLETSPPTIEAAEQQVFRIYYQIQKWMGNDALDPLKWG